MWKCVVLKNNQESFLLFISHVNFFFSLQFDTAQMLTLNRLKLVMMAYDFTLWVKLAYTMYYYKIVVEDIWKGI